MSEIPPRRRRTKDNHEFGVIRLRELPVLISCDFPQRIYDYWMANIATASWYTPEVECLCVVHLNTRRRATGFHLAGIGTLDTVLMSPREVFRTAILRNASGIVVAHSHPSGDPRPSDADIRSTRELIQAGKIIRIEVVLPGRWRSDASPWVRPVMDDFANNTVRDSAVQSPPRTPRPRPS